MQNFMSSCGCGCGDNDEEKKEDQKKNVCPDCEKKPCICKK